MPGRSWEGLAETLLSLMPPMVVADLGAGEGTFSQLLARRAKKVIVSKDNTTIIEGGGKRKDIDARAEQIRKQIEATTSATTYKPGDDARIHFHVTNARGDGVSAALGLQVVDEAVFALAEQQPGFAKVFFYLEQEAMKPRYEIQSLSMSSIVEPVSATPDDPQDRAAQALFAATEMPNPNEHNTEFGRTLPTGDFFAFEDRYQKTLNAQVKEISAQLSKLYAAKPDTKDAVKLYAKLPGQRDHALELGGCPERQHRLTGGYKVLHIADALTLGRQ